MLGFISTSFFHFLTGILFTSLGQFTGASEVKNAPLTREKKKEILISAASSLKEVFSEISRQYEMNHSVILRLNFAASGPLKAQIENGAPVDIFASASLKEMDDLSKINMVETKTQRVFSKNKLVLLQNVNNTSIRIEEIKDLQSYKVKKIGMGNPATVPIGRYTKEVLQHYQIFEALKDKLVFAESARQVLDYIARNEVDAAFVFQTDFIADKKSNPTMNRQIILIPENTHSPIVYPIAVLKSSQLKNEASNFIDFIVSEEGRTILKKYGF